MACEKEFSLKQSNSVNLSDVINWHTTLNKNHSRVIRTMTNSTMPLRYTPNWDLALEQSVDGDIVFIVPVNTNLSRTVEGEVSFKLVVKYKDGIIESRTVSVGLNYEKLLSPRDFYDIAFKKGLSKNNNLLNSEIRVFYQNLGAAKIIRTENGIVSVVNFPEQISAERKSPEKELAKEKLMYMAPPTMGTCIEIDWYLQTWEYDEYGDYLYFDEVYVGSTIECDGGGVGGVGTNGLSYEKSQLLNLLEQGDYKAQMSTSELAIYNNLSPFQKLTYLSNAHSALHTSGLYYPGEGLHNGKGDAFRYAYFSALNAASLGQTLAKQLGDAHETKDPMAALENAMDLFNNEVGRAAVQANPNAFHQMNTAIAAIQALLNSGALRYIKNGLFTPTNM